MSSAGPVEETAVLPPAGVAGTLFPVVELDEQRAWELAHGARIRIPDGDATTAAALGPDGALIGLVAIESGIARVLANFPAEEAP